MAVYINAAEMGTLDKVRVPMLSIENVVDVDLEVVTSLEVQQPVVIEAAVELQEPSETVGQSSELEEEDGDEEMISVEEQFGGQWLCPRSQKAFYGTILAKMRLWQRPPHDHCERCTKYEVCTARVNVLNKALYAPVDHVEGSEAVLREAGGRLAASAELRELSAKYRDLLRHVTWFREQRKYLKKVELALEEHQAMLQLDYGGFGDSEGKKVNVWSSTVLGCKREPEHFDFMFDAANQVSGRRGAKKDGQTGCFFLDELFDPARAPSGLAQGQSLFSSRYPFVTELIFSGDTGNGYRAYVMLEYLSKFFEKYGYKVKLIPLSPGHAWNRTDARIAHMNTFLNALKKKSRVFGANQIASAFKLATDPAVTTKRKYMARSFVFFRTVVIDQPDESEDGPSSFGPSPHPSAADGEGHLGVKSLLYFDFSVNGEEGGSVHPAGCARVRVHANPDLPDNPTFLFSWRKSLWSDLCQQCSDKDVSTSESSHHTLSRHSLPY